MASRWITALVDPPIASNTRTAFSNDCSVMMRLGVKPEPIFLKSGQTMRLGVESLGEQEQKLVAAE